MTHFYSRNLYIVGKRSQILMGSLLQAFFIICLVISSVLTLYGQSRLSDTTWYVDVDGARLLVRSVGSGTPLVFVHGGPGMSHDYLAPQLIELLSDEYRLIFYDQRASGRSSGVEDTTRLTMTQFVADLENVRRSLKLDRLNLVGHSFGGLLAMYYAAAHPNAIRKLLLLDTSPASWELNFPYFLRTIAERQTETDRQELAEIRAAAATDPAAMERYLKTFFRTFFYNPQLSDSIVLKIDDQWLTNNNLTGNFIWRDLGKYDIHDRLVRITAPSLIIHGAASVISVEGAKAIASRIPNSKLIVLKDVGHFPYIEAPQVFAAALKAFIW
jgi:proline iminopeptidase